MERQAVKSSNIAEVGYDSGSQTLEVKFKNGGIFQYAGVEPKHYVDMMNSESIGKHFHGNIRNNFKCKPLGREDD